MKFLKKLKNSVTGLKTDLSDLNKTVKWTWRFGTNKNNFVIEYISQDLNNSIVQRMFSYLLNGKEVEGLTYESLIPGEWVELPSSNWKEYEDKLIGMFPRIHVKNNDILLSKRLDELWVYKTSNGLKIKGLVKGLRK
jgi:hypothetical protein